MLFGVDFFFFLIYAFFMGDWFCKRGFQRWDIAGFGNSSKKKSSSLFLSVLVFVLGFSFSVFVLYNLCERLIKSPSHVPQYQIEQRLKSFPDKFQGLPNQEVFKPESLVKESPVVRSVQGGYSGYIEVNGVRKEVYNPSVVSETYRYRSASGVKYLPAKVNGIEFEMVIDTGASYVSLNSEAVRKLGVKEFTDKKIHSTAGGNVWAYYFPCSVLLGSFEVSNVQCSYNPELKDNLLGGSFLKNFNYSVNESEGAVTFSLR